MTPENQTLIEKINRAVDEIRPFLHSDGGDVEIVSIEETVVKVRLLGACQACDLSKMTLKTGIEETIKKHAPQITEVIAVEQ